MQLLIIILLLLPGSLFAQERGGGGRGAAPLPPPKNLKLLDPKTDIRFVMQGFSEALGVQCTHCHVQGDFGTAGRSHLRPRPSEIDMVGAPRLALLPSQLHQ